MRLFIKFVVLSVLLALVIIPSAPIPAVQTRKRYKVTSVTIAQDTITIVVAV